MTPQQLKAMKLALEALDIAQGMLADLRSQHQPKMLSAYTALEEVLAEHSMLEVQRLGQEIEQKIGCVNHDCDQCKAQPEQEPVIGKWVLREVYFDEDGEPIMHRSTPQPERHELQAKGEHPAPCARFCEANAFKIVIKNLKAQLAQPEQEPVAHCKVRPLRGDESFPKVEIDWVNQPIPGPLYTTPPQRTEQEPVAWMDADGNVSDNNDHKCFPIPLYTHPPQRTWVDVPDEEIKRLWIQYRAALPRYLCFAKALLARAKEENT